MFQYFRAFWACQYNVNANFSLTCSHFLSSRTSAGVGKEKKIISYSCLLLKPLFYICDPQLYLNHL